jgi:UDP-glucose 4-epimerase
MTQRALVTGASGFIGRALVGGLVAEGFEVTATDWVASSFSCRFEQRDLTQPGALDDLLTADTTVFHLAAHASVAGSVRDPLKDFRINLAATLDVLESVRRFGARLIFPSSAAVFDPESPLPHAETAPKKPVSPYGAAKLACESYCRVYHAMYETDVAIARLFNVYGVGMTRYAVADFYRKIAVATDALEILGDGGQLRDLLYIDDAVAGFLFIARHGAAGEDYNLATGVPTRMLDLARIMTVMMGKPELTIRTTDDTFPGDVPRWYANVSKLAALGFTARVPLKDGLERTIAWLSKQPSPP